MTPPLSIRLRVPGTNVWIVVTPTETPKWAVGVMDHASEPPEDAEAGLIAREWLLRAISDLRQQLWLEIQELKGLISER